MQARDSGHDRKAKPVTAGVAVPAVVESRECFEYACPIGFCNAVSIIINSQAVLAPLS